ncbi:SIS domain-containing protein [Nanoarchaeota archaeon]
MDYKKAFEDSIKLKQEVMASLLPEIEAAGDIILAALKDGKKLLVCGNGGSAAQAQHFAEELTARFESNRVALPAIALCVDGAFMTCAANDYGYENVFKRGVEAFGQEGDVLVGLTTSGNSPNVANAFVEASKRGMKTICLNGKSGGELKEAKLDSNIIVQGKQSERIQEVHITIIHAWCRLIEDHFA